MYYHVLTLYVETIKHFSGILHEGFVSFLHTEMFLGFGLLMDMREKRESQRKCNDGLQLCPRHTNVHKFKLNDG